MIPFEGDTEAAGFSTSTPLELRSEAITKSKSDHGYLECILHEFNAIIG